MARWFILMLSVSKQNVKNSRSQVKVQKSK